MRQTDSLVLLQQLLPIARAAGDAVMKIYSGGEINVQHKGDASPLTEADLAAHRILATNLSSLLPACAVVSEEDASSQMHRQGKGRFWLVDPLDGTKEFIAGSGEFTVNIALIENGQDRKGVVKGKSVSES